MHYPVQNAFASADAFERASGSSLFKHIRFRPAPDWFGLFKTLVFFMLNKVKWSPAGMIHSILNRVLQLPCWKHSAAEGAVLNKVTDFSFIFSSHLDLQFLGFAFGRRIWRSTTLAFYPLTIWSHCLCLTTIQCLFCDVTFFTIFMICSLGQPCSNSSCTLTLRLNRADYPGIRTNTT